MKTKTHVKVGNEKLRDFGMGEIEKVSDKLNRLGYRHLTKILSKDK